MMKRKILLSFLGTNNYVQTFYELKGQKCPQPVRFIQEALVELVCKDWTKDDHIYVFCTGGKTGSYELNWKDGGQKNIESDVEKIGLESRLKTVCESVPFEQVEICEGFSSEEVWQMFQTIYGVIKDGDEIYLDITHAFRSIPLFSTVLMNYARYMKHTSVQAVYYGAFEKLGPAYLVRKIPMEKRIAPIVDMSDVIQLQQITGTASSLTEFGRIGKLGEDLLQHGGFEEYGTARNCFKEIGKAAFDLECYIQSNSIPKIENGKYMIQISENLEILQNSRLPEPIKVVVLKLVDELKEFVPEKNQQNIEAAINWTRKYKMLVSALTLSQEYINTLCVEHFYSLLPYHQLITSDMKKREQKKLEVKDRLFMSACLAISQEQIDKRDFKDPLKAYEDVAMNILEDEFTQKVRQYYGKLTNARNIVNHGKGNVAFAKLLQTFDDNYPPCLEYIKSQKYNDTTQLK